MNVWLIEHWQSVLEITLISSVFLLAISFLEGTRGAGILRGLIVLTFAFIVMFLIANWLELGVIANLLGGLMEVVAIAIIVIFQPEIRRVFSRIGQNPLIKMFITSESQTVMAEILRALETMSRKKIGALIAIERDIGLKGYVEQGTLLDADVTSELLVTIFFESGGRGTPLHDGAVIIQHNRISAAGCLFPLTDNPDVAQGLGTRHRAAIGLTEESDAVTLAVSAETGSISLAHRGRIWRNLDHDKLSSLLRGMYLEKSPIPMEQTDEVIKDQPS